MKALIVIFVLSVASVGSAQTPGVLAPITPTQVQRLGLYLSDGSAFSAGWDVIVSLPIADNHLLRGFYRSRDGIFVLLVEDDFGAVLAQSPVWQLRAGLTTISLTPLHTDGAIWPDLGLKDVALLVVFGYDRISGQAVRSRIYWPNPQPSSY